MIDTVKLDILKAGLAIDKNSLDDILIHQPDLLYDIGLMYVQAVDIRDVLKSELAEKDAEICEEIREENKDVKPKLTEACLTNQVLMDDKHKRAYSKYSDAKREAAELGELKDAYSQRSYMIKDLCNLYINEYFIRSAESIGTVKDNTAAEAKEAQSSRRRPTRRRQANA